MSYLGLFAILLGFLAFPFAFETRTSDRTFVFLAAYVVHIAATFVYHNYTLSNGGDSLLYYFDPWDFYSEGLGLSTHFVVYVVQTMKLHLGGTFLDYFLLWQCFGFWGIVLLLRVAEEVFQEVGIQQPNVTYILAFLPGIQFWTSAIGKDGPLFFSVVLAIWAMMRVSRRFVALTIAIAIMLFFRPYVAFVALISLGLVVFFDTRAPIYARAGLLVAALAGMIFTAAALEATFKVDVTSAEGVSNYFERNAEATQAISAGTQVVGASFPVKLLSLLFRPLFFDIQDAFSLVASFENLFIILVAGTIIWNIRLVMKLSKKILFLRFALVFGGSLLILLAYTYYNVGLGLRQKTMFMPCILILYVALFAVQRGRRSAPPPAFTYSVT